MIGVNHDSRLLDIEEIGLLYQKICSFVIPELLHIYCYPCINIIMHRTQVMTVRFIMSHTRLG